MIDTVSQEDKIKLVIWDLDDTIWDGTLAENDLVQVKQEVKDVIQELNQRGIVNSICSKNDYNIAKAKLIELGMWDWFVFPSISFEPKGSRIKEIIKDMNLRTQNVLFIDDNEHELQEVSYYNEEIHLMSEDLIKWLLSREALQGKDDMELTRLKQYRQLEERVSARKKAVSNTEFLKSIHIRVKLFPHCDFYYERICELIERTNQLNFTKNRMTKEEVKQLIEDPTIECMCVNAADDFGNNGVVGFYAMKDKKLIHFLFSCRIINMGIEQWVYSKLGDPFLELVPPVAGTLQKGLPLCDYIEEVKTDITKESEFDTLNTYIDENKKLKIYAIGACDLSRMISNLTMPNVSVDFETNWWKGSSRGVNVGTEYLRSIYDMTEEEKEYCKKHFVNYTAQSVFQTKLMTDKYDYYIFSFHDDFIYELYEKKDDKNLRILRWIEPVYNDENVLLDEAESDHWLEENFHRLRRISSERLYDNLVWLKGILPEDAKIIFINGPEYKGALSPEVEEVIVRLNKVIKQFAEENPDNIKLIDVNQYIVNRHDWSDFVFHWSIQSTYKITRECLKHMSEFQNEQKFELFHDVPFKNRKIVLYGNDDFTSLAYYALLAHGCQVSGIYHHNHEGMEGVLPASLLKDKKEEYYVVVTGDGDSKEIHDQLEEYGYEFFKDYCGYVARENGYYSY